MGIIKLIFSNGYSFMNSLFSLECPRFSTTNPGMKPSLYIQLTRCTTLHRRIGSSECNRGICALRRHDEVTSPLSEYTKLCISIHATGHDVDQHDIRDPNR